ncbi:GAS2-like protein 2 [Terrapene carolina triunguis]|uniref:GAS2-like protein 2 n=1 Tax=Terrapene triunguis TaxID=2587831 RepID=UPI000E77C403|nr:GAS2-like protein 2 [Terrapene carolina triunguis]
MEAFDAPSLSPFSPTSHGKMAGIQGATVQSIRPYKSSEQYLYAMKEDLAEWLKELYDVDVNVGSLLEVLETGSMLCYHANNITHVAGEFSRDCPGLAHKLQLPRYGVTCNDSAQPGTFQARDNVSNFIQWCRKEMDIKEVLMFETEDLVLRKNEKNFVLCLLEVARRASRFGMSAPTLIQMEEEIEEEIREEMDLPPEDTPLPKPQRKLCDFKNLDQMVQHLVSRCTCPVQFSMIKVSEGKYRVGDSNTLIFVRILRNHVMVRVGGGWDTLEHYLDKHDPCRCTSLSHKQAVQLTSPQRLQAIQVQHEIKVCPTPRTDNPKKPQPTLIVSRSQSPLPPVEWRTYTPQSLRTSWKPRSSASPESTRLRPPREQSEPRRVPSARATERSATPSRRQLFAEERSATPQNSSTQSGRDKLCVSMSSLTSQLPGSEEDGSGASEALPEPQRGRQTSRIPGMNQKDPARFVQASCTESRPQTTVPKDRTAQLPRSTRYGVKPVPQAHKPEESGVKTFPGMVRSSSPMKSPVKHMGQTPKSSTKIPVKAGPAFSRPPTPVQSYQGEPRLRNGWKVPAGEMAKAPALSKSKVMSRAEDGFQRHRHCSGAVKPETLTTNLPTSPKDRLSQSAPAGKDKGPNTRLVQEVEPGNTKDSSSSRSGGDPIGCREERERVYTPLPINPAQERALYRSLEDEILSNIKVLEADSDESHCPEGNRLDDFALDCSIASVTAASDVSGLRSSTPSLSSLTSARQTLPCGEDVPRSGVYVPSGVAKWHPSGFPYGDVIDELSQGHNTLHPVDVENWITKIPPKGAVRVSSQPSSPLVNGNQVEKKLLEPEGALFQENVSNETKGNWLRRQPSLSSHARSAVVSRNSKAPQAASDGPKASINSPASVGGLEKSKLPQGKPKRSLKKPERVPSIYKLKLRPKIRPRRDNRPEKRPSKIPTPVTYRQAQKAASVKAQEKAHSSKHQTRPTQDSLDSTRQNSTGNAGSEEEAWLSEHSDSPQAGKKTVLADTKVWLTEEDEESWV